MEVMKIEIDRKTVNNIKTAIYSFKSKSYNKFIIELDNNVYDLFTPDNYVLEGSYNDFKNLYDILSVNDYTKEFLLILNNKLKEWKENI